MQYNLKELAIVFLSEVLSKSENEKKLYGFLDKLESKNIEDFTIKSYKECSKYTRFFASTDYGSGIVGLVSNNKLQGYLYLETGATFVNKKYPELNSVEVSTIYIPEWNRDNYYLRTILLYFLEEVVVSLGVNSIVASVAKEHDETASLVKHYLNLKLSISHIKGKNTEYIVVPDECSLNKRKCKTYALEQGIEDVECYLMFRLL